MKSYSKISKINDFQDAASNSTSKNSRNTAQLVDNRVSTSTYKNNNTPIKQLKSNLAIASFNSNVAQLIRRRGKNFSKDQRLKKLAINFKQNKGFYTCNHCGFKNTNITYATFKGKRMGDGMFQLDHIKPASKGGKNKMKNGRILCGTCNTSKGNRAHVGRTGIDKYRALHGKKIMKNYLRKPNK